MSRRPRTQRDRVLVALKRAGRRGLTQIDFHAPHVVDGGTPITRLAPRIREMREQGHQIISRRDNGLARYVLVPPPRRRTMPVDVDVDARQLELPAPPPASPFDPLSPWA